MSYPTVVRVYFEVWLPISRGLSWIFGSRLDVEAEGRADSVSEDDIVRSAKTSPNESAFSTLRAPLQQQQQQANLAEPGKTHQADDEEEVLTPPPSPSDKVVAEMGSPEEETQETTEIVETYRVSEDGKTWKTMQKTTVITAQGTTERTQVLKEEPVLGTESSITEAALRLSQQDPSMQQYAPSTEGSTVDGQHFETGV
ncbi:hypothetical protein ElyMa_006020400 [Elysia marginata]|uniref:Band 4.1 C-terminal domain-containing protein n=1 Tax=Elysia marginata TaxID=1093978 RepID=A0AAV4GJF4_9GAST|nr:hypothetical protein ElyMa_006020400 [Elysia marginata]